MEIDLPDVVAEVTAEFERYEKAVVDNDVATLDAMFHDDPRTVRYGVSENLYGFKSIAAFPSGARSGRARAHAFAYGDHHLWPGLCGRVHDVSPAVIGRQDRSSAADLGALFFWLARGCRSRQSDRSAVAVDAVTDGL